MDQRKPLNLSANDLHGWLQHKLPKPLLIDVREDHELHIAPFPFAVVHLPLSKAENWMSDLPEKIPQAQPIVVLCHSGIRSLDFANWVLAQGLTNEIWNLDGGIDAWSLDVDQNVPRY